MKLRLNKILCVALLCVGAAACDDYKYNHTTSIAPFTVVPTEEATVVAIQRTDTVYAKAKEMKFRWKKSAAVDGTAIFYEVVFAGEGGSLINPAYSMVTNTLGTADSLELDNEMLNVIAERCGIEAGKRGKIRWSVMAGNGPNKMLAANESAFEVVRPVGFAEYPNALFLMGSATSAGDDLSKGLRAVRKGKGEFEIFAELGQGTYYFVDKIVGVSRKFEVKDFQLKFGSAGISPHTGAGKKTYRFNLVFYNDRVKIVSIDEVDWMVCNNPTGANPSKINSHSMIYQGACVWQLASQPAMFDDGVTFSGSTAYKFKVNGTSLADGSSSVSYFGSLSAPSGWTASAVSSWYYLGENSDYLNVPTSSRFRLSMSVVGYKLNINFMLVPGMPLMHTLTLVE